MMVALGMGCLGLGVGGLNTSSVMVSGAGVRRCQGGHKLSAYPKGKGEALECWTSVLGGRLVDCA